MGRIAGAYGVRGWVKVAPEGGAAEGLVAAREWWIGDAVFEVERARLHGGAVVGKPVGVDTREKAGELKGRRVAVQRDALPEPEEGKYYLADLVGLEVVNGQGEVLGKVVRTLWNGAQDVIEVVGERSRLIPWVPAVVREVDLAGNRVRVEWESGW